MRRCGNRSRCGPWRGCHASSSWNLGMRCCRSEYSSPAVATSSATMHQPCVAGMATSFPRPTYTRLHTRCHPLEIDGAWPRLPRLQRTLPMIQQGTHVLCSCPLGCFCVAWPSCLFAGDCNLNLYYLSHSPDPLHVSMFHLCTEMLATTCHHGVINDLARPRLHNNT